MAPKLKWSAPQVILTVAGAGCSLLSAGNLFVSPPSSSMVARDPTLRHYQHQPAIATRVGIGAATFSSPRGAISSATRCCGCLALLCASLGLRDRSRRRPSRIQAACAGAGLAAPEAQVDDVASRVKELQRSDPLARQQWSLYCKETAENVCDPSKHSTTSLNTFLSQYDSGALPEVDRPEEGLVDRVKELQRSDRVALRQWRLHCKGIDMPLDPWSHPTSSLNTFLSSSNTFLSSSRQESKLAVWVREGQRGSQHFTEAWRLYCERYGEGVLDPSSHAKSFISGFMDFLGQNAVGAFGPEASEKALLVARVKAFQRVGETQRQAWAAWCETHLDGVYDPAKHDKQVLEAFFEAEQQRDS